jgi:folate-binding protein YgfZ
MPDGPVPGAEVPEGGMPERGIPEGGVPEALVLDGIARLLREAAWLPLGRDVVAVTGPDALAYLQGQCSQDLEGLEDGQSAEALLLSPQGKLDALVRVTRRKAQAFVVDVTAGFGPRVLERLRRFLLRVKARVEPLDWGALALRGPAAAGLLEVPGPGSELLVPAPPLGPPGIDLLGPAPEPPPGVPPAPLEAWEVLRIEAGLPEMGRELDERTIPAEAGLVERTVSFTKGCYTGQELVARLEARGSNVARRLRGLVVAGPGALPPAGTPLVVGEKTVGAVTSAAWSPHRRAVVALGYLHRSVELGATVALGDPLDGRSARVVGLPFPPADPGTDQHQGLAGGR